MKKTHRFSGFTFMEVLVILGILGTLFGLTTVNILGSKEKASEATTVDVLVSDFRSQQLKAMLGDTEGRIAKDAYGVRIGATSYVLFHGASYLAADPANYTVNLGDNERFQNILFPNNTVIFASISGEIVNFSLGNDSFILRNTASNEEKTVQLNKYGVITSVN